MFSSIETFYQKNKLGINVILTSFIALIIIFIALIIMLNLSHIKSQEIQFLTKDGIVTYERLTYYGKEACFKYQDTSYDDIVFVQPAVYDTAQCIIITSITESATDTWKKYGSQGEGEYIRCINNFCVNSFGGWHNDTLKNVRDIKLVSIQ